MDLFLDPKYLLWSVKEPKEPDYLSHLPTELKRSIIQHLSVNSLGHLAQASRFFYGFATPVLYDKDAREQSPRAIVWAAEYIATPADAKRVILKVLDLAVRYGGDVNQVHRVGEAAIFAPLHLAAARGNIQVAESLLQHGANPNALGRGLLYETAFSCDVNSLASRMPTSTITIISRHSNWRPLFIPFLMENEMMVELLLRYGASPVLAVPIDEMASATDPCTINLLHILSARQSQRFTDNPKLQKYFKMYPELINVPIMVGLTPLFFSLDSCNDIVFKAIMANGGNIESVNDMRRTPLMQAITCYCNRENPDIRQWYKEIIEYMVRSCNAKVGNLGDAGMMDTPLSCIIKAIPNLPMDWKHAIRDISGIIGLLLEHGADPNERPNAGFTLLHLLCDIICTTQQPVPPLLDLFSNLVEVGADLNIPSHDGRSVLGTCIIQYKHQPPKFYNLLLKLGASLAPQEIDTVFVEWADFPAFRKSLNMIHYKDHLTQPAIDSAYENAFDGDDKLFELLKKHFPKTTIAERVASEALLTWENHTKPFNFALELSCFNGRYIHDNGNSLLHSIVDRLETFPKYKDARAREDAYEMLRRGAPLEHKDSQGNTPLKKLRNLKTRRDCPILRLFLFDVKYGWGALGKEPTQDVTQKRLWRNKRQKVLDDARE